jgi:hypothetical protein
MLARFVSRSTALASEARDRALNPRGRAMSWRG